MSHGVTPPSDPRGATPAGVTLDWASEMLKNQPDTALMEYQQQLWQNLGQVKSPENRRGLLNVLGRLNIGGRAALYDMLEGADAWPPSAPKTTNVPAM